MKKFGVYLISILLLFQINLVAYDSDPKQFVTELVNDAINKRSDKNLSKD